jgi:hypothetical protein
MLQACESEDDSGIWNTLKSLNNIELLVADMKNLKTFEALFIKLKFRSYRKMITSFMEPFLMTP